MLEITAALDEDKRNCLLLSRLACNGKMLHPAKGYSGPLSRHLLAYQCLVSSVRSSLRDLVETVLAVLLLEADAERIREDFLEISEMFDVPCSLDCLDRSRFIGCPSGMIFHAVWAS